MSEPAFAVSDQVFWKDHVGMTHVARVVEIKGGWTTVELGSGKHTATKKMPTERLTKWVTRGG